MTMCGPAPDAAGCAAPLDDDRGLQVLESLLRRHPGVRPSVQELSAALALSPRRLRLLQLKGGGASPRTVISNACVDLALSQVRQGVKIEAAMWEVGLRSRTSFNRRCRRHRGTLPSRERPRTPAGGGGR